MGKTDDERKGEDSQSGSVNTGSNQKNGGPLKLESSYLVSAGLENSAFHAIPVVLTGDNYNEWSHVVRHTLMGRSKIKYVDGKTNAPSPSDEAVSQIWMAEDAVVAGWLINSMVPSLRRCFMYMMTSKEIWEGVKAAFGARGNATRIFDIKTKVWDLKQKDLTLGDYYIAKTTLWSELDELNDEPPCCNNHLSKYYKNWKQNACMSSLQACIPPLKKSEDTF